ncbi:MAG: flagellar hook-associated protein FlgK [Limibaculum sp.]
MSLTIALQNALSGLQTNEAMIQVIANNVSNANVEGYTRKISQPMSLTLAGIGRGVEAGTLTRVVDERLLTDLRTTLGALGDARAQDFYYNRILDQFGTLANNASLGAMITDLATAMQGLAASPDSSAHRTEVVTAASALARQLNQMSQQIQTLRFDADRDITAKINVINVELTKVAELNVQIASAQALGDFTGELEDIRDQALNQLSELIDVRYFKRTSGEIVVTLPDGRVLADKVPNLLSHTAAGGLSPEITYAGGGITAIMSGPNDITASIKTGELHGIIEARDTILPNLQAEIDELAQMLRDEVNELHNTGTSRPPPNTLTGTRTFAAPASDTITFDAAVRIAAVDANGNFVAHYDLAAGTYTITQIEALIDTNLAGYATASTSANGPLTIAASASANGIAIVDLSAQTVTHTDGATTYTGFSNYFGLNDLFVTPTRVQGDSVFGIANMIKVRGDIEANPALLARGALDSTTSPAPKAGNPGVVLGDASIIQKLADKFLDALSFSATGNLPPTTTSFAGYASEILSTTAVAASSAAKTAAFQKVLFEEISFRNASLSGVNIDEELRNMVLYENAYAATARIIQVVDELFEILLRIGA